MGSVWRASDEALGRTVAVKVFWAGTTEDADAVRRESEKRLLASRESPVARDAVRRPALRATRRSYLVMEYIDGGTLASLIASGPIAPLDAASLAADLGEALHVVHEAGIIHRDVKPANILLRPPLTPASHVPGGAGRLRHRLPRRHGARDDARHGDRHGRVHLARAGARSRADARHPTSTASASCCWRRSRGRRAFPQQTPVEAISARLSAHRPTSRATGGTGGARC